MAVSKGNSTLKQIQTNNNVLKHPSLIVANMHGKVLSFKVPVFYQQFTVIVTSNNFAISRQYSVKQAQLPLKDLRHTGLVDSSEKEGITMSRKVYKL